MIYNVIGENIKRRRMQLGLTQAELGRRVRQSQQNIGHLETGKTAYPAWLPDVLKVLKITFEQAQTGKFQDFPEFDNNGTEGYVSAVDSSSEDREKTTRGPKRENLHNTAVGPGIKGIVPLISLVKAGQPDLAVDNLAPGDAEEWLVCPVNHSTGTYALTVSGDSMTAPQGRSFPEGIHIFVDPEQRGGAVPGDLVVAKVAGRDAVTFKQLAEDEGRPFLRPLNPKYDPIFEEFRILGRVIYAGFKP